MMIDIDPADKSKPTNAELIAELIRMKCVFQLRTIAAVLDLPQERINNPMTDAPTIPEGFTAHDGGACPVHPDTIVKVLAAGGEFSEFRAGAVIWDYSAYVAEIQGTLPTLCGIIAYKVITPYVEQVDWQAIAGELADALEVYGNGIGHSEIEDGGDIARQALAKYNDNAKEQST